MKIEINQNFLEAVEFPRLLDILTKDCQTPSGRDYLRMLRPLGETLAIEERLGKTRELEKQILKQAIPSIPDPQRFIEAFGNAREKGEAFSGKELTALLKFLRDVVRLRQYFSKQDYLPQPVQVGQNSSSTLTEPSEKAETIRDTSVENTVTWKCSPVIVARRGWSAISAVSQGPTRSADFTLYAADRRHRDEGWPVRDDDGNRASPSPWTEPVLTSSHEDPGSCQWFSRLTAAGDVRGVRVGFRFSGVVGGSPRSRHGADGSQGVCDRPGWYQVVHAVRMGQPESRG